MRIAVIGWGSLIWRPGDLKIASRWHRNGPALPVEFSRVSKDNRLTLVIAKGKLPVTTLWALSVFQEMEEAIDNLRRREGAPRPDVIGRLVQRQKGSDDETGAAIRAWLSNCSLDAAVWTNLPPRNPLGEAKPVTEEEATEHIRSLSQEAKEAAEEYVRKTPEQVETEIRKRLRIEFGWENHPLPPNLFVG